MWLLLIRPSFVARGRGRVRFFGSSHDLVLVDLGLPGKEVEKDSDTLV